MRLSVFHRTACFVGLLLIAGSAQSAVRASIDTNTVGTDGTIELTLEHDGQTSAEPDLSPLRQDFDVLSSSRSSNIQIVNGSMSSSARIELTLSPKHAGQLQIPALRWGNEQSTPLVVNVNSGVPGSSAQNSTSGSAKVFLKTSIDPRSVYLQAGVDLTVRLYSAVPLYHADLELPVGNDAVVQQVGADRHETIVENGEHYQVLERHYELFPQRSGSVTLSGPVLDAQMAVADRMDPFGNSFKDFFGNLPFGGAFTTTKPIRLHGDDITLDVRPRPAGAERDYWLPARDVSLQGDWHPAHGQVKAGDPVTLDLHLKAQGLTAAQLPDLNSLLKLPTGLKAYPDQAKLTNDTQGSMVVGQRDQSIALIADRSGEFTIPALSVRWWDTKSNEAREVTLPARTLSFAPGAISASANSAAPLHAPPVRADVPREPKAQQNADSGLSPKWWWATASLAVLWVATLLAWYFSRRTSSKPPVLPEKNPERTAAVAQRRFADACRRNDARAARASLIEWISASKSSPDPVNLQSFARQSGEPNLIRLLCELDRACYGEGAWDGASLLEALHELPAPTDHKRGSWDELEPLYK